MEMKNTIQNSQYHQQECELSDEELLSVCGGKQDNQEEETRIRIDEIDTTIGPVIFQTPGLNIGY